MQHCGFVIIRKSCTDVDDRHITLLQIHQQSVDIISMDRRQTVHIVHNEVVAVASQLLTLQINQQINTLAASRQCYNNNFKLQALYATELASFINNYKINKKNNDDTRNSQSA